MKPKAKLSMGCDPELFLVDANGNPTPSIGLFGGDKKNPKIINKGLKLGILEDNVTLEFNLKPAPTPHAFIDITHTALKLVECEARKQNLFIKIAPSLEFSEQSLSSDAAKMSGCDPDRDAYSLGAKRVPISLKDLGNWRCAGGHIHFGYDKANTPTPDYAMVQFLDAFALLFWYSSYGIAQHDTIRMAHYGKPGVFRSKEYGIEYRTPSPVWLNFRSSDGEFLNASYDVMCGILADARRARQVYDAVNWKEVNDVLSRPRKYNDSRSSSLRESLYKFREEVTSRGRDWIYSNTNAVKVAQEDF